MSNPPRKNTPASEKYSEAGVSALDHHGFSGMS
jgi:hypothetical protein